MYSARCSPPQLERENMLELRITIGLLTFSSLMLILFPISLITRHKWFCRELSWHDGKDKSDDIDFDGCSFHAKCSKCGKEVMKDSQGNWF
jgi:hypothetical protein